MRRGVASIRGLLVAGGLLGAPSGAQAATCIGENAPITPANIASAELALLCRVNVYRQAGGVGTVVMDTSLRTAARNHSQDMIDRGYFDHINPDGKGPSDRAVAAGYPNIFVGENLAANCCTASAFDLFEQWRLSTLGHNENMLDADWKVAGMGLAYSSSDGSLRNPGVRLDRDRDDHRHGSAAARLRRRRGPRQRPGHHARDHDHQRADAGLATARRHSNSNPTSRGRPSAARSMTANLRTASSPFTSKRLPTGRHTITVTAIASTIPDPSPATKSFTIKKKKRKRR